MRQHQSTYIINKYATNYSLSTCCNTCSSWTNFSRQDSNKAFYTVNKYATNYSLSMCCHTCRAQCETAMCKQQVVG